MQFLNTLWLEDKKRKVLVIFTPEETETKLLFALQSEAKKLYATGYSKFFRGLYKARFGPFLQFLMLVIPKPSAQEATLTLILLSKSLKYMLCLKEFALGSYETCVLPPEVIHNLSTNTSAACKRFDFWYQSFMFDVPLLDLLVAKKGSNLAYLQARVPRNREVCKRILSIAVKNLRVEYDGLQRILQPFSVNDKAALTQYLITVTVGVGMEHSKLCFWPRPRH